ncbi:MAG: hypothetical protein GY782_11430 [Gammaproteobacteria bacterium]|nr:hypothetical protein [Gammaproteobacteria bacterium]
MGLTFFAKTKKAFGYGCVPMIELPKGCIANSRCLDPKNKKKLKATKILPIKKTEREQWHQFLQEESVFFGSELENEKKDILDQQLSVFDLDPNIKTTASPKLKAFFDPSIGENEKKKKLLLDLLIEQFRLNIGDQKKGGGKELSEIGDVDVGSNLSCAGKIVLLPNNNKKASGNSGMIDLDDWANEKILNFGLLLFIEGIARNPDHPLHQLINHKLKAEWAKKVRGYSAGHMNWLLNTTYWLRMTPIDLFYNGREMSRFDGWTGYHGITGNPLMMLRGFFYLKGFIIGITYFYHSGKFDYVIFCNTLNDGVWFTANTINITDNFIQLHRAIKYHRGYYEPTMANVFHSHWLATHAHWLNSAGACSAMFSGLYIFFDLPRDLSRDAYLLWEVYKHPKRFLDPHEELWKRFWSLVCNFICNVGMGGARIGMSFSGAATFLSAAMPGVILALFLLTVAYGAWKLSKIKRDKNYDMSGGVLFKAKALPLVVFTSLFVLAPTGIALMVLAGGAAGATATAMLASGGAIFVAAAMMFGLSTYYFLRSRGIDQAVCVRLSFMSAMMGLLITGAVFTLLFATGPFSGIAVTGVLFVVALGAFREWNKNMAVIRENCNKDKRNEMLEEAWKSYGPVSADAQLEAGGIGEIKKDHGHQMLALEAYKLRECTLILKSSSEESARQQISNRARQKGVYTLIKNKDGKTATLFYQDADDCWQEESVPIKSIPKAILEYGWGGAKQVIRPMMAKAKFITSNGAKFYCGENSTKETQYLKQRYAASWCSKFPSKKSSDSVTAINDPTVCPEKFATCI